MSKGIGEVQRRLKNFFWHNPEIAITAKELCISACWSYKRSKRVSLIRAAKALAERGFPIGWMQASRSGATLVFYRSDNKRSVRRAEMMCRPWKRPRKVLEAWTQAWHAAYNGCGEHKAARLGRHSGGPRQKQTQLAVSPWYRPTAAPGGVASAFRLLLREGIEPTTLEIIRFFDGALPESTI